MRMAAGGDPNCMQCALDRMGSRMDSDGWPAALAWDKTVLRLGGQCTTPHGSIPAHKLTAG